MATASASEELHRLTIALSQELGRPVFHAQSVAAGGERCWAVLAGSLVPGAEVVVLFTARNHKGLILAATGALAGLRARAAVQGSQDAQVGQGGTGAPTGAQGAPGATGGQPVDLTPEITWMPPGTTPPGA